MWLSASVICVYLMFKNSIAPVRVSAEIISRWLRLPPLRGQSTFFWETLYLC